MGSKSVKDSQVSASLAFTKSSGSQSHLPVLSGKRHLGNLSSAGVASLEPSSHPLFYQSRF